MSETSRDSWQAMMEAVQAFHDKHDFKNTGGEELNYRVALMAEELGEDLSEFMPPDTAGTGEDEQIIDALHGNFRSNFLLHYNFPPYSVGEAGRVGPPGRREIGHGKLAWRALQAVLPEPADSSAASSWPWPLPMSHKCSFWMSRPRGSIPTKSAAFARPCGAWEKPRRSCSARTSCRKSRPCRLV